MKSKILVSFYVMALSFFAILWAMPCFAEFQEQYVPGEILVKFKSSTIKGEINDMNISYGVSIIEYIEELDIYRLKIPSESTVSEMIDLYNSDPRCEYAEPNYLGGGADFFPDDTFFPQQWHLDNKGQTGGTADADVDAVEGWQITTGSNSVVVAVLDTGIDSDHPEFQGRLLPGFDFVNNDNDPEADHPHGVYVSGILAANADNNFSVAGIDHNVKILPVKVLNSQNRGTTFNLANGIIFAANNGVHVINMSLINYPTTSTTLNNALQFARNEGAILIACAGNGGIGDADISGPGASFLTISVGATDHSDKRASFSSTGTALDIVAPGLNIPTVSFNTDQDVVSNFSGCSAATPVASGTATLLLSLAPLLTHDDVHKILIQTAEDLVGPSTEDTPGRDDFFGHGRLNINEALLTGKVIPLDPGISCTPQPHGYGEVTIGESKTQTFTCSSTGNSDLVINIISISGPDAPEFTLQNDNCSSQTLPQGGNCTVDIVFLPTSEGEKSATLSIASNALDSPFEIQLTGKGKNTITSVTIKKGVMIDKNNVTGKDKIKKIILTGCTELADAVSKLSNASNNSSIYFSIGGSDFYETTIQSQSCTPNKKETKYKCKEKSQGKVKVLLFPLNEMIKVYISKAEFGNVPGSDAINPIHTEIKIGEYTYQSIENWTIEGNKNKTKYKIVQ